jgi:hypothetical protein
MSDFINIIEGRKDISFKTLPFDEVDGMVFSRLCYIKLDHFFSKREFKKISLKNAINKILANEDSLNSKFVLEFDLRLIEAIRDSKRYKKVYISDFEDDFNTEIMQQFSATLFTNRSLLKRFGIYAFRGTDGTDNGWKENLYLSVLDSIPSQIKALEFVEKKRKLPFIRKFIYSGHSKGGNLAIYSGILTKNSKSVTDIYAFDSPGFSNNFIERTVGSDGFNKIKSYIPECGIVGRLMNIPYKYTIVASNRRLFNQHYLHSWEFEDGKLITLDSFSTTSDKISSSFTHVLSSLDNENRKLFIDAFFKLGALYTDKLIQSLFEDSRGTLIKLVIKLVQLDPEERNIILKVLGLGFTGFRIPSEN